jgi:putative FmdB family regulatory protein
MKTFEYVCLSCGRRYSVFGFLSNQPEKVECPQCKSTNVAEVDLSRLFEFSDGG